MSSLGLLRRREVWWPTRRGWLLLLLLLATFGAILLYGLYPFLAPQAPNASGALVVEGWVDDGLLDQVVHEYQVHRYTALYCTGGPVDPMSLIKEYGTYANYGASRLQEAGLSNALAVPSPATTRDRTFTSGLALRDWLRTQSGVPAELTILTSGPHARRSRLLFQKAFGEATRVGVISLPPREYDPARWWQSSSGFREVVGETIAYLYARLIFWRTGD